MNRLKETAELRHFGIPDDPSALAREVHLHRQGAWLRAAEAGVDDGFDQWERDRGVTDYWEARYDADAEAEYARFLRGPS